MKECENAGCARQSYVTKTSILTSSEREIQDLRTSSDTIRALKEEHPGLTDVNFGRARHEVAPGEFYLVERWAKAEDVNDDALDAFVNATKATAQMTSGVSEVSTSTCASERTGTISLQMGYPCRSIWKVIGSPSYCAWVPRCKFMRQTDLAEHAQLYMDDGSILNAAIVKKEKDISVKLSVLISSTNLRGYSRALSLKKVNRASCQVNYYFYDPINDATAREAAERNFEENFVPNLYTQLSN